MVTYEKSNYDRIFIFYVTISCIYLYDNFIYTIKIIRLHGKCEKWT